MNNKIRNCFHPRCIVCSSDNPRGLQLTFDVDNNGNVEATFHCDESFEGYPGIIHGGILSLILDAAMGQCIFARGQAAVTIAYFVKNDHKISGSRFNRTKSKSPGENHTIFKPCISTGCKDYSGWKD